jgi:hypothetical protein
MVWFVRQWFVVSVFGWSGNLYFPICCNAVIQFSMW